MKRDSWHCQRWTTTLARSAIKGVLAIVAPIALTVLVVSSGTAWAQYTVSGSDALTQVIQAAITASGANLTYLNVGSGQAEKNIAKLSGYTDLQSIAPISRNFLASVLTAVPSLSPKDQNVIALDAGIIVVGNSPGHMQDIALPLADPSTPAVAAPNSSLAILLGGYPAGGPGTKSSATTAECADPHRIAALSLFSNYQGSLISHLLRRDDKSSTQDIFRQALQFDRWCNGKSEGNLNAPGSNLQNSDLDPIRKPCSNTGGAWQNTRCTYYPLNYPPVGQTCQNGQTLAASDPHNTYGVAIPCTQGLIVALSEPDAGMGTDVNVSIASRVNADLNVSTVGLAGVSALLSPYVVPVTINQIGFTYDKVRSGMYMFSYRHFLQHRPDCLAFTGNAGRCAEETKLFNWATKTNRCDMQNIVTSAGLVPPLAKCWAPCPDPLNITCLQPSAGTGTPKQNIGAETTACDSAYPCVANGKTLSSGSCGGSGGNCPSIPVLGQGFACPLNAKCSSTTCQSSAVIPICN